MKNDPESLNGSVCLHIFVLFLKSFSLNLDTIMLLNNYEVVVVINYIM